MTWRWPQGLGLGVRYREAQFETWAQAAIPDIMAIEQLAYSHPWTAGNFQDSISSGYRCVRLCLQGETLGYHVAMRGPGEMHLLNLTVAPDHQRRGLGERLLGELIDHCKAEHLQTLWLEVRQSNQAAQALYAKAGFASVGQRKHYYPLDATRREDAVVMKLELQATQGEPA
jgi:[ribosomal protein S18]-alanine N-acetyltransferase